MDWQYFYVFGSSYSQLIDQDRLVTSISQEIRNPLTGRLARLSPNSCIIYKVERDIYLPPSHTDADGNPINQPVSEPTGIEGELKK